MKVDYIALSIPVFFILIGIELLYSVRKKLSLYRVNDSVTNISLGIGQQVTGIFMKTALFYGYLFLFENFRLTTFETTLSTWIVLFLGVDFFYYWFHRVSHEVNALWAAHIVHHQSEEYNLSVALRQSWFQNAFSWVFYLPLAVAGFEPIMFLTISSFNTLYQFWIHTRTIGKMGPLEWILNTPSHHRVHHGSNVQYLDKNHGGTLIIWDRLFGTFAPEEEEPYYGITKPLRSWNPVWANFHYWAELFRYAGKTTSWREKIRVFFSPPGWRPAQAGGSEYPADPSPEHYGKYDSGVSAGINAYILVQLACVIALTSGVLFLYSHFTIWQLVSSAAWILLSIVVFGGLFDRKKWAGGLEMLRLTSLIPVTLLFAGHPSFHLIVIVGCALSFVNLVWFYFFTDLSPKFKHSQI